VAVTFSLRFPSVNFADLAGVTGALAAVAAEAKAAWAAAAGVSEEHVKVTLSAGSLIMQLEIRGLADSSEAEDVASAVSDESLVAESVRASPVLLGHLGVIPENLEPAALAALEVSALVDVESAPVVAVEPRMGAEHVSPPAPGADGGGGSNGIAGTLVYGGAGGGVALVALIALLGLLVRRRRNNTSERRRGLGALKHEPPAQVGDFGLFVLAGESEGEGGPEDRAAVQTMTQTMTYNPLAHRLSQALGGLDSRDSFAGGLWAGGPGLADGGEETTINPLSAAQELGDLSPEGSLGSTSDGGNPLYCEA